MFTALVLSAMLPGSPVPKDARPAGPAPRVVEFVPDSDGKVRVPGVRQEARKITVNVPVEKEVVVDGKTVKQVAIERREQEVKVHTQARLELSELENLTVYTADGKEADRALALKKLADGGVVVLSTDGKKVDPKYLKLFRDDTLVLVSPALVAHVEPPSPVPNQMAAPRAGLKPLPLPVAAPAPAAAPPADGVVPRPLPAPPVAGGNG